MSRRRIRGLKTRVGRECSISRGGARLYSKGMPVGRVQGESVQGVQGHSVTSPRSQCYEWGRSKGREAPRVRAVKSYEFGEGKL